MSKDFIVVKGAKMHNLKNINVSIPRNKLTVITGLSGSGKSSLAFDTIYAEGQRRYVESLSTYARQFLQNTEKPEVDSIEGLSPAISIDQKTATRNPRSTVGTVTEIYDYLRLLYAKIGHPHCPECGREISRQSITEIIENISKLEKETKILILSPVIRDKKGAHQKVIEKIKKEGFVRVRIDREVYSLLEIPELEENKRHSIDIVVDRLVVKDFSPQTKKLSSGEEIPIPNPDRTRIADSLETALRFSEGLVIVQNYDTKEEKIYSELFSCPNCNINIPEISPRNFSFNSPHGACEACHGLGTRLEVDADLVITNKKLTLGEGAIAPWSATTSNLSWYNRILTRVGKEHGFDLNTPIEKLTQENLKVIFYGTGDQRYKVPFGAGMDHELVGENYFTTFEGVIPNLERRYLETDSDYVRKKIEKYMRVLKCPVCHGKRLKKEMLSIKIDERSIIDLTEVSVINLKKLFQSLKLSESEEKIAQIILKEIYNRLQFLEDVGLSYLTLDRGANTLSG